MTFKGDVSEEEKTRILSAIRQYLVGLKIGNVVVRDAAVKSDDKRTWGQTIKDLFNKDYQTLTVDFNSTYFKDQTFLINGGDMVGKSEFADLRKSDPGQWSNIVAWRSLHEKIAHDLNIGSDMDQGGGLAPYQRDTLVGGPYGRGRSGIPGLHPTDVRRLQEILVPRKRSYGR